MGQALPPIMEPAPGTTGPTLYLNPYTGQYITNRTYALRLQRGFARGFTSAQARRGEEAGVNEYQKRLLNFQQRYGFDERLWKRWQRKYINEINSMTTGRGQITRSMVQQVLANSQVTGTDAAWVEGRLKEKLADMKEYRAIGHGGPGTEGFNHFWSDASTRVFVDVAWWWYH